MTSIRSGRTARRRSAALRRRVAVTIVLLGLLVGLGLGTARPAHAEGEGAVDAYGGCLVARKAGDLLIVVDESRSLEANDPQAARVSAAKYLLTQLNGFATRTQVTLDVSVAGFSHSYAPVQDWTTLDAGGLTTTTGAIDSFTSRPFGFETDYWVALEGARRSLAAKNPDGNRCQAVVWISDGELDVDFRRTDQERRDYGETKPYLPEDVRLDSEAVAVRAETEAARQLCRSGGLADQLRSSKVSLFGIGLRGQDQPDYTLMRSIALGGTAGGQPCGTITEPPGSFTEVADIDDLLFEFDKFRNPSTQPNDQNAGVCQGEPCTTERHTFVLDDSIRTVHVLANSNVEGAEVYLIDPTDKPAQLQRRPIGEPAELTLGGGQIDYTWQSERTVTIDMTRAGTGWAGPWSVVFVDPTGNSPQGISRTSISISGDVVPTWPQAADTVLRSGETAQITLGLADATGAAIDPTKLLGTVVLDATLTTADGTSIPVGQKLDKTTLAEPLELDLSDAEPGTGELTLSLAITTADGKDAQGRTVKGTALRPQTVAIPISVEPPAGFPTLGNQVNFGTHEGRADAVAGTLSVTGPGCVWVEGDGAPQIQAGPEQIGEVSITSPDHTSAETCLRVEEGQQAELPLALTTTGVDNGTLNATFTVRIAPLTAPDQVRDAAVPATASFEKPLNPVNFVATLVVAAILGPGLPLLLLYLMKFVTSTIPGRALLAQEFVVQASAGQLLRDGRPFALQPRDLTSGMVPLADRGSRSAAAGSARLEARMGASPFGAGHVEVVDPDRIGASSSSPRPTGKRNAARLPLHVHNHWVLLHDPQGPPDRATVLLLVGGDAPAELRQSLVDDLNGRGAEVLAAMRAQVGAPPAVDSGAAPFGPGGPGAGGPGAGGPQGPQPFDFGQAPGGQPAPWGAGAPSTGPGLTGPAPTGPAPTGPWGPAGGGPQQPVTGEMPATGPTMPTGSSQPWDQQPQQPWGEQQQPQQPWGDQQQGWGQAESGEPPQHQPSATPPDQQPRQQPALPDQQPPDQPPPGHPPGQQPGGFRPSAPAPGTQISNPFDGGDR